MTEESADSGRVLVVDDDRVQLQLVRRLLEHAGYQVDTAVDGETCLRTLTGTLPDAVVLDLHLPGLSGSETLERILARHPRMPVVMLTMDTGLEQAVSSIKAGAFDYLTKPADGAKLVTTLRNAVAHGRMTVKLSQLEQELRGWSYPGMLGESQAMRALFRQMDRVAQTDVTVLIYGESGTGKELVAQGRHTAGPRREGPLVTINCAAIPESLQESELFGHERGSFTGATTSRQGKFELANRGTIFLDEVGELTPSAQAKVLRVVQEGTFQRVGGQKELKSDFRLIAATHRNLLQDVEKGRFREDLYYRLAVFEMEVPPLRERGEDVVLLARHFAQKQAQALGVSGVQLTPEALDLIGQYRWPGNVRELENAIERAVVASTGGRITPADFPARTRSANGGSGAPQSPGAAPPATAGVVAGPAAAPPGGAIPPLTLEELERLAIEAALERAHGNLSEVSRVLGIGRTTLYAKLRRYGLRGGGIPEEPPSPSLAPES